MDVQFFSLGSILLSELKWPRDAYEQHELYVLYQRIQNEENP